MSKFVEMDAAVALADQLRDESAGPVVLINTLVAAPADAEALLQAWSRDAAIMKRQPGFISTQLHKGLAGSGAFLNYAVWQSVAHFRDALNNPEFKAQLDGYPESTSLSPHLFRKLEVPGVCVA